MSLFVTWRFPMTVAAALAAMTTCLSATAPAEVFLVKGGQPQAEIVIAEKPARSIPLAAEDLQAHIEKISGAKLPIVTTPGKDLPVKIYVGRSAHTDRLGVTNDDLRHAAFRVVSQVGANPAESWLVLIGGDREFVPRGPFPTSPQDSARVTEEWDKLTGGKWENPLVSGGQAAWRHYNRDSGMWGFDEHGSFNAVADFLYSLGVRWYLPDPLGEVIPRKADIELPAVNRTVRPDFPLRYAYQYGRRFSSMPREELLWQLRMGFHLAPEVVGPVYVSHGTAFVIKRKEMREAHPEYYALINGERQNGEKYKPCLSSEALIQENARFARAVFDIYDAPMISVMPTDGFTSICQCDGCKGKATPERGWEGQFSDYVWNYVNRVAQEVYKTHPDRKIIGMAYTTYMLPPEKIEKLSPNVVVLVAQGRAYRNAQATRAKTLDGLRKAWLAKLPEGEQVFAQYEYYRWAVPDKNFRHIPAFGPKSIAADLRELRGISLGDYIEVHREKGLGTMGVTGLNLYVTARYYWDATQDIDALLDEYYTLFYGPARDEMKALIEFCEFNFSEMRQDAAKIKTALDMMAAAQAKAPADSIYGQRMALVADYIEPLWPLYEQLAKGRDREKILKLRARDLGAKHITIEDIVMDGKLDDAFWKAVPGYGTAQFKELFTGGKPVNGGVVKVAWANGSMYFGIKCMDHDMKGLKIGATKNDDTGVWNGDCIEILIETQSHSYYQIAISPSGAVVDIDRKEGINTRWSSDAQVAAFRGDDHWSLEVRIPVAAESQRDIDALNGLAGRKPDSTYPWYFNVCRQRFRGEEKEYSAISPTGKSGFHHPMSFAELGGR